jgi:catalase
LQKAATAEGAVVELIAPAVGGITASDGALLAVKQKINGGPSVLYDAVALLPSEDGAAVLSREATAKDFVSDAFAHAKFIAYSKTAQPLLDKGGVEADGGCLLLQKPSDAKVFVQTCRQLRFWEREAAVHAV